MPTCAESIFCIGDSCITPAVIGCLLPVLPSGTNWKRSTKITKHDEHCEQKYGTECCPGCHLALGCCYCCILPFSSCSLAMHHCCNLERGSTLSEQDGFWKKLSWITSCCGLNLKSELAYFCVGFEEVSCSCCGRSCVDYYDPTERYRDTSKKNKKHQKLKKPKRYKNPEESHNKSEPSEEERELSNQEHSTDDKDSSKLESSEGAEKEASTSKSLSEDEEDDENTESE